MSAETEVLHLAMRLCYKDDDDALFQFHDGDPDGYSLALPLDRWEALGRPVGLDVALTSGDLSRVG
jgi:hypothetical protein